MTTPTLTNKNVIAFERTGETRAPTKGESVLLDGKVFTLESDSVIACEILRPIPNAWVIKGVPEGARMRCFVERIPQPGLREPSPDGHRWAYPKVWPAGTVAICDDGKMLMPNTHDTYIAESTIVYDIIAPEPAVASETTCPICGGTEFAEPLPGTSGRRCVKCCKPAVASETKEQPVTTFAEWLHKFYKPDRFAGDVQDDLRDAWNAGRASLGAESGSPPADEQPTALGDNPIDNAIWLGEKCLAEGKGMAHAVRMAIDEFQRLSAEPMNVDPPPADERREAAWRAYCDEHKLLIEGNYDSEYAAFCYGWDSMKARLQE